MIHQTLNTLAAVILLDQLTKYLAVENGIVSINQGISFGFAEAFSQGLLVVVTVGLLLAVWFWQRTLWQRYPVVAGFLFGGGISNVIDRIVYAGVRDWLPVPGFNLTNNLADWSISLSIAALLLLEMQAQRAKMERNA